jgi:pimeloyl-ACP methyl ester carboxylesterase
MQESYIPINGCEYYVRDSGDDLLGSSASDRDPVILLHGWPDDCSVWRCQIPDLLASGYRTICLDWLGHGKSEKTEDLTKYTLASLSRDIVGLMDALKIDKAHCIAHDYGAVVAWELATRYPERLKSYVALSVGHPAILIKTVSWESLLKSWYLIFNPLPIAIPLYRAMKGMFFHWVLRGHPDRDLVVNKFLAERDPFYIRVWEQANPIVPFVRSYFFKKIADLEPIKVPTLGIVSKQDNFMAQEQMKNSGTLVSSKWEYICIDNCNHWLQLERPQEINQHILQWLKIDYQDESKKYREIRELRN